MERFISLFQNKIETKKFPSKLEDVMLSLVKETVNINLHVSKFTDTD